jgi:hypothetical protein
MEQPDASQETNLQDHRGTRLAATNRPAVPESAGCETAFDFCLAAPLASKRTVLPGAVWAHLDLAIRREKHPD